MTITIYKIKYNNIFILIYKNNMDIRDISALSELLFPGQEEDDDVVSNPNKGSIFAPGDIG